MLGLGRRRARPAARRGPGPGRRRPGAARAVPGRSGAGGRLGAPCSRVLAAVLASPRLRPRAGDGPARGRTCTSPCARAAAAPPAEAGGGCCARWWSGRPRWRWCSWSAPGSCSTPCSGSARWTPAPIPSAPSRSRSSAPIPALAEVEPVARVLRPAGGARRRDPRRRGRGRRAGPPARGSAGIRLPVHGRRPQPGRAVGNPFLNYEAVTPDYFRATGLRVLQRPRVHRGRPRRRAEGGDPGPERGAAALARRRSGRPPDQVGRARQPLALGHRRRGGGGRPLPRAGDRLARRLRPPRPRAPGRSTISCSAPRRDPASLPRRSAERRRRSSRAFGCSTSPPWAR